MLKIIQGIKGYETPYHNIVEVAKSEGFNISVKASFVSLNGNKENAVKLLVVDEKLVGVITIRLNKYHAKSVYASIYIASDNRRRGYGKKALEHLKSIAKGYDYIQFGLTSDHLTSINWLKKNDIICFRKTYEGQVNIKNEYTITELYYQMKALSSLTEEQVDLLVDFFIDSYKASHVDNPLTLDDKEHWKQVIFDDNVKDLSLVMVDEDEMIGFSLVYRGEARSYEMAWQGVKATYRDKEVILKMLQHQMNQGLKRGISSFNFEIDSTNIDTYPLIDVFSIKDSNPWLSYHIRLTD